MSEPIGPDGLLRWEEIPPRICQFLREVVCRCGHAAIEHMDGDPPIAGPCLHADEFMGTPPCGCRWFDGDIDGPFFTRPAGGQMREPPKDDYQPIPVEALYAPRISAELVGPFESDARSTYELTIWLDRSLLAHHPRIRLVCDDRVFRVSEELS